MFTENEIAESAVIESTVAESTAINATQSQAKGVRADIDLIPNLYGANVVADTLALNDSYLSMEQGEIVRGVLIDIEHRVIEGEFMQVDKNTGVPIPVEVVSLLIQTPEGEMVQKTNCSTMLVGVLKDNLSRGTIQKLKTPIQITYLGKGDTKKKTRFDKWDVRLLSFAS
jgi:hypothetical protein